MSAREKSFDRRWIVIAIVAVDVAAVAVMGMLAGAANPGAWPVLLVLVLAAWCAALIQASCIMQSGQDSHCWMTRYTLEPSAGRHREAERQRRHEELAHRAQSADLAVEMLHNVGNLVTSLSTSLGEVRNTVDCGLLPQVERALDVLAEHRGGSGAESPAVADAATAFLSAARRTLREEKHRLQSDLQHADQLLHCVADMLAAQQLLARTAEGSLEWADPVAVVRAALAINDSTFRRLGIQVHLKADEVGEAPVPRSQLLQVVNNLIKNAADAVAGQPHEQRQVTIGVSAQDDDHLQIRVADSGCGIPAEQLPSVFQHGFTTKLGGHGFGLSSCARLVQEFDGSLTAASEGAGRGAVFTVTLPRNRSAPCEKTAAQVHSCD